MALTGKSLDEVVELPDNLLSAKSRGQLGNLVEEYYFGIKQNSDHRPDFPEAGLELKTTGVTQVNGGKYKGKERLVLSMINYSTIIHEEWHSSSFREKSKLMLILFYLYDRAIPAHQRKFVLNPLLYEMPPNDLEIIRRDWEFIRQKVRDGKAHELSEGDTFYLGACRKGSGGDNESLRTQPNSELGAKARAFSFKQSYLTRLIEDHYIAGLRKPGFDGDDEASLGVGVAQTFEEATAQRFSQYVGKSIDEISESLEYSKTGKHHKSFHRDLANRILSDGRKSVRELQKADIELKTIRLTAAGVPREAMSFPSFKFNEIINEEWENSTFFEKLERKFLFVIFRLDADGVERLAKVSYWNMPYADRLEAKSVWEETRRRVAVDARNLPKSIENRVSHVRPKARNKLDTLPTPQGTQVTKQCFWLNKAYLEDVLASL
jgi:DNA mismatch repair protein MutH